MNLYDDTCSRYSCRILLLLCMILLSLGCTQMGGATRHGWEGPDYEGKILPTSQGLGARALQNWTDFDLDVKKFLEKYRKPDFIRSESMLVDFYYIKENVQVTFDRPAVGFRTKISTKPISNDLRDALIRRGQD